MKPAVRAAFVDFTAALEGAVPFFYLDVRGLVTVAIGNLVDPIDDALGLPFVRTDGSRATWEEIAADWRKVKSLFCGMQGSETPEHKCPWRALHRVCLAHWGWTAARGVASLRLPPDGVRELVMGKLEANHAELRRYYPRIDEWPADAQLATHSMAWACGPAFGEPGPNRFPRLAAALRSRDFIGAAHECQMNASRNAGLVERNTANRILYKNAAHAKDPDRLYWPSDLSVTEAPTLPKLPDVPSDFEIVHPPIYMGRPWEDDPDKPPEAA
jgi:hypothetical protein